MNDKKLNDLARLAAKAGAGVEKDQIVVINSPVESYDFARRVMKACYDLQASEVIMRYSDIDALREQMLKGSRERFENVPAYTSDFLNETAKEGACYIHIIGDDPDALEGTDPSMTAARGKNMRQASHVYRSMMDANKAKWTIVPAATEKWAAKAYPELSSKEAVKKLWDDIFDFARIDGNDPVENWEKRKESFLKRMEKLNSMNLKKLIYKNSKGTNLSVELPEGYEFIGGGSYTDTGKYYFPNIPTEEIFTAPKKTGVNGILYSSMPLIHNGIMADEFFIEFKDGKAVNWDAKTGKEVLDAIIDTDENAAYLGELALVEKNSPISKKNRIYYETLLDENASCHFALGQSYSENLKGGLEMSSEELEKRGMNQSLTHVDFMVGTDDLSIVGIDDKGNETVIFENGNFAPLFD